ncbi:MAG: amino acid ABC transporter permease [Marmoricola sp.]
MNFLDSWLDWSPTLLNGLWLSIRITFVSLLLGLPLGMVLAVAATARRAWVRYLAIAFIELGRGAPAIVVLQLFYFGLPSTGLTLASMTAAVVALGLTTAAFTSEILRGGINAVPPGTLEASAALAVGPLDTLRYITLPQALRIALAPLLGFAILIFQATALCTTIAVPELLSQAYSIGSSTFQYLSVLILAGLMYAVITIPSGWLVTRAEARMSRHLRPAN